MLRRLLFLSVLFAPLAGRAQEAPLQLAYVPGVRYTLTQVDSMDMHLGMTFDGQAMPSLAPMRMATLSVADFTVEARGDEWRMTRVERRRRTWSDGAGGVESVDTDSAASVAASPVGPLAVALIGRPVHLRIARDGRVLELLGRDSLLAVVLAPCPAHPRHAKRCARRSLACSTASCR